MDHSLCGMRCVGKNQPDTLQIFSSADEAYNYLHIKNLGTPVAAEDLPKLFDKFFHTPMNRDGSGLGLYFCRKAMHYFGGEITCNISAAEPSHDNDQAYVEFVLQFRKEKI